MRPCAAPRLGGRGTRRHQLAGRSAGGPDGSKGGEGESDGSKGGRRSPPASSAPSAAPGWTYRAPARCGQGHGRCAARGGHGRQRRRMWGARATLASLKKLTGRVPWFKGSKGSSLVGEAGAELRLGLGEARGGAQHARAVVVRREAAAGLRHCRVLPARRAALHSAVRPPARAGRWAAGASEPLYAPERTGLAPRRSARRTRRAALPQRGSPARAPGRSRGGRAARGARRTSPRSTPARCRA